MKSTSKIRSRWSFSFKNLSRQEQNNVLKSKYILSIASKISRVFVEKKPECSFNEIRNAALYGFWKALNSYDPERGKFSTYATHVCTSYIWNYYNHHTSYKREAKEILLDEYSSGIEFEQRLVDRITIEEILSLLDETDRHIVTTAFIHNDISKYGEVSKIAGILGMSIFGLQLKIERILKKARGQIEKNLCID